MRQIYKGLTMRRILLLAFLFPGIALADTGSPIYQATPTNHTCISGRNCAAAVDINGRLITVPGAGSGSASSMAEATVIPQITAVPGSTSIPSAATTPQFINTVPLCSTFVQNNTNVDLDAHLANAATASHRVPAGSEYYENWCAKGQKMSGNIGVFVPSTSNTPAAGQVVIGGTSR